MAEIAGYSRLRLTRDLVLTFLLAFLNLAAVYLAISAVRGLHPWSDLQFVGLIGVIEASMGLAFFFAPNVWRLPVAAAEDPHSGSRVAAQTLLTPHWAAGARLLAGCLMVGTAAADGGLSPAVVLVPLLFVFIAATFLGVSLLAARFGIARPDLDVVFISISRPQRKPLELPGISLSGIAVQLLANVLVFPAVVLLRSSALFRPELGPSWGLMAAALGAALLAGLAAVACWRGRVTWERREKRRRARDKIAV